MLRAPLYGTKLGCPGIETVKYGAVCHLSCDDGYVRFAGSNWRKCQNDGTWSGEEFVCKSEC